MPAPVHEKPGKKPPRWAIRVAELRSKLGMNQTLFGKAVGADQGSVSRWEKGDSRPMPDTFAKMAKLAPDMDKFFFLEEAGLPKEFFMGGIENVVHSELVKAAESLALSAFTTDRSRVERSAMVETQMVPILSDPVAAGNPLTINDRDIEMTVPLPAVWLPQSSNVFGLRVDGDSMEPIVHDNDIALVDVNRRDIRKLEGCMVAVRVGDGVTIKWLRKQGKFYQLVPQNTSPRHEIRIVTEDDDWSVIGEVVKFISEPPKPPKRR